jgi:hypothetical protein
MFPADDDEMDSSPQLSSLVQRLCGIATMPDGPTVAVAHSATGAEPEVLIPPACLASSSDDVVQKIVGALARGLSTETTAVGVLVPAVATGRRVDACAAAQADGHAVCVAGRIANGVASVGVFRSARERRWSEAHAELDWLCEPLRLLVSDGPLEADESASFTVGR